MELSLNGIAVKAHKKLRQNGRHASVKISGVVSNYVVVRTNCFNASSKSIMSSRETSSQSLVL